MKCPKCGYLGFETGDRCRNCGYDFSLSVRVDTPSELPLQKTGGAGDPLADFTLAGATVASTADAAGALDLDRVIGDQEPPPARCATPPAPGVTIPDQRARPLPLFTRPQAGSDTTADDAPLLTTPRPVRAPLSVRRATPDIARGRPRAMRSTRKDDEPVLDLGAVAEPAPVADADVSAEPASPVDATASTPARLVALTIDGAILAGIDFVVMYLTLAIAGLTVQEWTTLPWIPMASFLILLNGGYLVAFVAASGQTIGKMAAGIKVIRNDGLRVDVAGAALRAGGCALSLLTAGLGYLPALMSADRRALHDRIAGTRVIAQPRA